MSETSAKPRAGDRRSDGEIERELAKIYAMQKDVATNGAHLHILLGMEWALKWASHRGNSPSWTIKSLSKFDDARSLAQAYDALTARIDRMMQGDVSALFGKDGGAR